MHTRILQIICGVAAASALLVAPAVGSAATATAAGGSSQCRDHYPPHSWWNHGWYGHDGNGPYWRGWGDGRGGFGGGSYDSACNALDHHGRVAKVMVAVQRLAGAGCRNLHRTGHLGATRDCARAHWLRAHGTQHWHYAINRRLPRGAYVVYHRVHDKAGNHGRIHRRLVAIR
jgi:hypothetical protein